VVLIVGALAAILWWKWDPIYERFTRKAVVAEQQKCTERIQELQKLLSQKQPIQQQQPQKQLLPTARFTEVFGPNSPIAQGRSPQRLDCQQLEDTLRSFCRYLDGNQALKTHGISQDSWPFFTGILASLDRHKPTISGEAYRAPILLQNSFFFFRLLRQKKIAVIRDIINSEADLAEPLMGTLYHWLIRKCGDLGDSAESLKFLYRYAGFFLQTLGGHSYLIRRDSKIALLTMYYSVLAVHQANEHSLNEEGIDLRFFLPILFSGVQSRNDLLYSEDYLQTLSNLQLKYFGS